MRDVFVGAGGVPPRRAALRALAGLAAAATLPGLVACGTPVRGSAIGTDGAELALLGVTVAPGVVPTGGTAALEALATAAFERSGPRLFDAPAAVREAIDPGRLDAVLAAFGRSGALVPEALQTLMAAPIRRRRALLLRVEGDAVERPAPVSTPVADRPGRRRIVQTVLRRVRVSGTEIDLNGGAVRPLGTWTTAAEARTEHLSDGGDGFVASVAATLAGRMAGRPGAPPPPEPPPSAAALQVLFEEIARELPAS